MIKFVILDVYPNKNPLFLKNTEVLGAKKKPF